MALNFGAISDFLGFSVGIQILKEVKKFLHEFGIVAGLFVGHAPELRLEFAMRTVAYTLIKRASMNIGFSKTC